MSAALPAVEAFIGDVRYAVRGLGRSPGTAAAAILAAAVGVGAVASMYSVLQTLLLSPPPHVDAPDRVFRVHVRSMAGGPASSRVSYPFYERLAAEADSLASAAAAYWPTELAAGAGADARLVRAVLVSAGFWRTLRVRPRSGVSCSTRKRTRRPAPASSSSATGSGSAAC